MKMRLGSFLVFTLLSLSIMLYGTGTSVFADNHDVPPMSVSVEVPSYDYLDTVVLSGSIKDYDSNSIMGDHAIIMTVFDEKNNFLIIGQFSPLPDGSFTHSFTAGGEKWMAGTNTIKLNFGSTVATTTFLYSGGGSSTTQPSSTDRDSDGILDAEDDCPTQPETINNFEDEDGCPDVAPPPPPPPPVTPADRDSDGILDAEDDCPTQPETINNFEDEDGCPDVAPPPPPPPTTIDPSTPSDIECGEGTELVDGVCTPISTTPPGGTCLIATAAYGTELAPQIQLLREVRDNTVLSTASGSAFMAGFNSLYYSFAPTIADWERENTIFKESVRMFITPMISSLSIMTLAQSSSEAEVLGLGISVIVLNLGMYIAAPAFAAFSIRKYIKSRKLQQM